MKPVTVGAMREMPAAAACLAFFSFGLAGAFGVIAGFEGASTATTSDMPLRRSLCVQIVESGVIVGAGESAWTNGAQPQRIEDFAASAWTTEDLSRLAVSLRLGPGPLTIDHKSLSGMLRAGRFDAAHAEFRALSR